MPEGKDVHATIDMVKEYWDRRPCNLRHSNKPVGSRPYFDEVELRKYTVEPHIPGFAEFERWRGKDVLEIGCGIGTDAVNFARAGAHYSGIELSRASLELTRRRFDLFGLTGKLVESNAEDLKTAVAGRSFDLVYSFGVIHHTPRPRAVIESARQVIRRDGVLKIMLYAKHSWKAIMIAEGFDQPEAQSGCPIAFTYDRNDVEDLLRGCFTIQDLRQAHIFPYAVEDYVEYRYRKQPWFEAMPSDMFAALERHLGWHMLITAVPA